MDIDKHIQAIVDTLGTDAEPIPLRRAMRLCLADLDALRRRGLTWATIAARLTRAGARGKRGQAISPHNLRTEYARLSADQEVQSPPSTSRRELDAAHVAAEKKRILKNDTITVPASPPDSRWGRLSEILRTRPGRLDLDD
jgi:hypothetical protein